MRTVHSILAVAVLIALGMAVFNSILSLKREEKFKKGDRTIGLIALILTHTQMLLGLITYYVSPWYESLKNVGMGKAMKDAELRLMSVEHPFTMIIAIVLITIGWSRHKKLEASASKYKSFAIFYGIGLLLILARIPWSHW